MSLTYQESKELDQLSAMFLGSKSAWKKHCERGNPHKVGSLNDTPIFEMKKEDPVKMLLELRSLKTQVDLDRAKKAQDQVIHQAVMEAAGSVQK